MDEDSEPDWLAELAKGGEALRRQVEPLVEAAEQFVRDARRAKTRGPVLPLAQRVALAVDELLPRRPVAHERTAALTVTPVFAATATAIGRASLSGVGTLTASGSVALPSMRGGGQFAVEEPQGSLLAGLSPGQILAIALVWVVAYALPIYLYSQAPTSSTLINADVATFAFAYVITCQILAKRKSE